ncbi:hypothetical protein [Cylindrospermopsis raciborskii]|uniref:hypothetical protein n=1 Tax=Cylindrospermopsis raciborskii TaxID=77022 RepID=UPI001178B240|nr:hypothetical protein [Cylindrospermopsis raciborskii]
MDGVAYLRDDLRFSPKLSRVSSYFLPLSSQLLYQTVRQSAVISNWYEIQRNLFTLVVREHIFANLNNDRMI